MDRRPDRCDIGPISDSLLIRCRSCTPASTVELTGWLEDKVAELRAGTPPAAVRLTRLVQDLPMATVDDGWLLEIQLEGERPERPADPLAASLEEILRDMRILGLDPTLLVPAAPSRIRSRALITSERSVDE